MKLRQARAWSVLLLIIGAGLALPLRHARAADDGDITQKVQAAKTASDHEAIARYYDEQAAEAKKNAGVHRRMGETYKGMGTAIGKGGATSMSQHCESLAKNFEQEATNYEAMAQVHRDLAKAAK